ncbi:MAG TPA: GNAT family N-acetyltransferase [Galbitalea sp.]|jgi:GNAT superfamily N-acetyltransferase|nr:GNAT family N-acetyltransferase [Galbitalea sp.]
MVTFRDTNVDDPAAHALIADYFDMRDATFPHELGAYTPKFPIVADFLPPKGVFVVLVDNDGEDIGCGGVRGISPTRFEIKHLWVQPRAQGRGLGRLLLGELESRAAGFGATEIVLDTNASLRAAGGLYRTSGYLNVEPYNDNPNATDWFWKKIP